MCLKIIVFARGGCVFFHAHRFIYYLYFITDAYEVVSVTFVSPLYFTSIVTMGVKPF